MKPRRCFPRSHLKIPAGRRALRRLLASAFFLLAMGPSFLEATADEESLRQQILRLEKAGNYKAVVPLYEELCRRAPQDSSLFQDLAQALTIIDDHGRIVELLKSWLHDHPDDIQAYLRLGRSYLHLSRNDEALKTWRQALVRAPERPQLYRQISHYHREAGLYKAAIQILMDGRKALRQDQLFGWELAALYLLQEDYRRAIAVYLDYLREDPQRLVSVEYRLAPLAQDASRAPKLLQALENGRKNAADPLPVSLLLATCALESGDPQKGYDVLSEIAALPDVVPLIFKFASRCQDHGYDEIAIQAYALGAEHGGDSPYLRALLQQATIHLRLENHDLAAELYSRLARQFPRRPEAREALFQLGRLQLEVQNDVPGAQTSLQAVLQSASQGPWAGKALDLLAECALRQDDFGRAEARLHQLGRQDPAAAQVVRYRLAELAYFQGDNARALGLLKALLEEDPRHPLANDALELILLLEAPQARPQVLSALARAQLRERQKRPEDAAEEWAWLAAHAPPRMRQLSLLSRARIREQQHDPAAALALYERMVADHPRGAYALQAHIARARLYEQQGRIDHALKIYETALLGFPEDVRIPEIRLQIQRLRQQGG